MTIFLEILRASDEVSGPIFVKHFRIYIYRLLHGVFYVSNGKIHFL